MRLGKMYEYTEGGEHSNRFFHILWEDDISAGAPSRVFQLHLVAVRGMQAAELECDTLAVPVAAQRRTRSGGLTRDEFVSRFIRGFCMDSSGVGVVLRRVGAEESSTFGWVSAMISGCVPFSRRFGFGCIFSAVIDGVNQVSGVSVASILPHRMRDINWERCLKPVTRFFRMCRRFGVPCRNQSVPEARPAIDAS